MSPYSRIDQLSSNIKGASLKIGQVLNLGAVLHCKEAPEPEISYIYFVTWKSLGKEAVFSIPREFPTEVPLPETPR